MADLLLMKAQNGDADAFTALCMPFENMVYRHCLQMLNHEADAQDAAQEAMLRAYRAIGRFRGGSDIATWLYRIAHNVCIDMLRRPRVQRENASLDAMGETGFDPADAAPDPEETYVRASEQTRLTQAIAHLPEAQQALLTLRYGDGLSYEELARVLKLGMGTVKSRISRAKEKLRSLLGDF